MRHESSPAAQRDEDGDVIGPMDHHHHGSAHSGGLPLGILTLYVHHAKLVHAGKHAPDPYCQVRQRANFGVLR